MALFIGLIIILIVLFMVFAMALAEWADKDPGELLRGLIKKEPSVVKTVTVPIEAEEEVIKEPGVKTVEIGDKKITQAKDSKRTVKIVGEKKRVKKTVKKVTKKITKTTKLKKRTTK